MFAGGELGGVYNMSSSSMYQDAAKTMPATSADHPVRVISPVFGSGDATAPNDAARPLLKISGAFKNVKFDLVDDDIKVPLTTPGSLFIATTSGMYWGEFDFSLGQSIGSPLANPKWPVVGLCAINRVFTLAEIEALKSYFSAVGGVGALPGASIRVVNDTKFTTLGLIDTSNATNMQDFASGSQVLQIAPINVKKSLGMRGIFNYGKLTSFPYEILYGVKATDYTSAFAGCNLNSQSVDGILTTIRDNANTLNLNNGNIGIHGGTNAAPTDGSVTGMNGIQAKADLIARGWTVNTN